MTDAADFLAVALQAPFELDETLNSFAARIIAAHRGLLSIHGVNHQCVPIPGIIGWTEQPCETLQILATAYGWEQP